MDVFLTLKSGKEIIFFFIFWQKTYSIFSATAAAAPVEDAAAVTSAAEPAPLPAAGEYVLINEKICFHCF